MEDKRPTLQHFMIAMEGVEPWSDPEERRRDPGDLFGILFQARISYLNCRPFLVAITPQIVLKITLLAHIIR